MAQTNQEIISEYNRLEKLHTLRKCDFCDEMFMPKNKTQRFCSRKCSNNWGNKRESKQYKKKSCKACGKEFYPTHCSQRYCKDSNCISYRQALKKIKYAYKRKPQEKIICPICNKKFEKVAWNRIYCGEECRFKATKKRNRERALLRKKPKKPCLWCQEKFEAVGLNHKFCSQACRQSYNSVKKRVLSSFAFKHEKTMKELDKLKKLGKNYR